MVPKLTRRTISRPRLLSRLHAAVGNGVTILEAPAGFGKTTLAAQFATDLDFTPAWLSLDTTSGAPELLAHQLGICLSGDPQVEAPATASKLSDLQAYVGAHLFAAVRQSERPILLVIDNVHELVDEREAAQLLAWVMDSVPDGVEILLSGRERPFLPSVNALVATGDVVVLDSTALAFTAEEVRELLADAPGTATVSQVLEDTAGWPVGVMAALNQGASTESITSDAFSKYLDAEVWASVPEDLRAMLRRLSLLPTISRSAVDLDFGPAAWRNLSSWMASHEFLCEQLTPVELRLNPLLRQFIASEFDANDPIGYAEAFQDVIDDMVQSGSIPEAIELARSCGNERQLAALLEVHSPRLIIQGSLTLLWRGFEALGEPTLRRHPLLRSMFARITAHLGDPEDALRRADGLLRDPGVTEDVAGHALLARVRALRLLGRLDEVHNAAARLANLDLSGNQLLAAEQSFHLADIELSVTRDFSKAETLLSEVVRQCEVAGIEPLGLLARSTLGQSMAMRGDAPAAVTVLTRAAQGWRRLGRSSNLGWVLNNLGMAHIQAGDFSSAASVLREAVEEGKNCGNQRNVAYATASLGDAELALGNFAAARVHFEESIRICATDALDESLAALSIGGLSAALLGSGDKQQADFFSRRALLVALSSANSYETAMCKLQQAAVDSAMGNFAAAIASSREAAERFTQMDVVPMLACARYREAMAHFKSNDRPRAQELLVQASEALREPWMAATLIPLVRENPMFAQWAASRVDASSAFAALLEKQSFESVRRDRGDEDPMLAPSRFPAVSARSLGQVSVTMAGRELGDEEWASARAKEMFFLLLANRDGIRKEEAVEFLYPDLPREKCNSAFHSNLYRIRRALYQDSVVKGNDGIYQLNPDASFEWDVEKFENSVEKARRAPSGSRERAVAFQEAIELYSGPFAVAFHSEWAESVRSRLERDAHESLATLAGYFAGREDFESAALCMERVLKANQFNEEAAYQLARYRSRAGQVVQALRFIDEYGETYSSEFGEALPSRFGELRASIAAGVAV